MNICTISWNKNIMYYLLHGTRTTNFEVASLNTLHVNQLLELQATGLLSYKSSELFAPTI
jgi:hypothetical protein